MGTTVSALMERINFCRANTETELSQAVQVVGESEEELQLLVVDNITMPLLRFSNFTSVC